MPTTTIRTSTAMAAPSVGTPTRRVEFPRLPWPPVPQVWSSPVRFIECDQQGVVFNAHYLVWADEAVNAWWTARGVPWGDLNARGLEYLVVATALNWRSSARWGDTVEVDADLDTLGRTSLAVRFAIRVGERVCCEVRTTYVCTADGVPTPWPDQVRALLTGTASGQATLSG